MFDFTHNLDSLADRLSGRAADAFSLEDGSLSEDVQEIVAEGQMTRIHGEVDPQFQAWAENEPKYKARKGGKQVGELTGEMIAADNIKGTVNATDRSLTIRYAGSAFARQKLAWFEAGGRKLWGLDDQIRARLKVRTGEHVAARLHGE